jgi:hypothetical protein
MPRRLHGRIGVLLAMRRSAGARTADYHRATTDNDPAATGDVRALASLIPRRGQHGSIRRSAARFATLRWAALPITDRRWTVPLSAAAVGMGLFIGVAIGPGAENTLGTESPMVVVQAPEAATPAPHVAAVPKRDHPVDLGGPGANAAAPPASPSPPASTSLGTVPTVTTPPVSSAPPVTTTTAPSAADDQGDETTTTADSEPTPVKLHGTVVRLNRPAASYVLATPAGELQAIHSHDAPSLGNRLEVEALQLANGTYVEDGKRIRTGSHTSAQLKGVVTFIDRDTDAYTVSSTGASLLIHPNADESRPELPRVGSQVVVSVAIGKPVAEGTELNATPNGEVPVPRRAGCGDAPRPPRPPDQVLTEVSRRVSAGFVETSSVEGIVQRACPESGRLVLSADDVRESGADVEIAVPQDSGIDLTAWSPGDVVDATVAIGRSAGALTLSGIASDDGAAGADDAATQQGAQGG